MPRFIKVTLLVFGVSGSLFLIISAIVLSVGLGRLNASHRSMEEFFEWQAEEAVLTSVEKRFQDSLIKEGFYIEMHRPYIDRLEAYENFTYKIVIEPYSLYKDPKNYQLLDSIRENLARQLIKILPDSVLLKMNHMSIRYQFVNEKTGSWDSRSIADEFPLEITKPKEEIVPF